MNFINRVVGEDGRTIRTKRRQEALSNLIGNRKAMQLKVDMAAGLDTPAFCVKFPTARRAWLLPVRTALDSDVTFDK
ncbi:MAG: hypothetical protein FWE37_06525 [Spirochaetaceae bacterium]|nr:hypothetical protein [Spirochaetaceae bacterium]